MVWVPFCLLFSLNVLYLFPIYVNQHTASYSIVFIYFIYYSPLCWSHPAPCYQQQYYVEHLHTCPMCILTSVSTKQKPRNETAVSGYINQVSSDLQNGCKCPDFLPAVHERDPASPCPHSSSLYYSLSKSYQFPWYKVVFFKNHIYFITNDVKSFFLYLSVLSVS